MVGIVERLVLGGLWELFQRVVPEAPSRSRGDLDWSRRTACWPAPEPSELAPAVDLPGPGVDVLGGHG
ncbi:hypothetical protein ACGFZZ_35220 [Streptomyces tendae]|uniref:hypothetical protein n=1 Tax=Streptomyces tendae TaxID=1932 RepID=UPI0033C82D46